MSKEVKTNAMRMLDKQKIAYRVNLYECDNFIDGVHIADMLGQSYDSSFKTLVTVGKSGEHYVFALPIHLELEAFAMLVDMMTKGDGAVISDVKEINAVTGYIRGGCTPLGMKKRFPTVLHESILALDEVIISGGRIGAQIVIAPADLIRATNARTADIVKEETV